MRKNTRVIILAGPTIQKDQVLEILPKATVLPPADQAISSLQGSPSG